jgi:hypothetical protein
MDGEKAPARQGNGQQFGVAGPGGQGSRRVLAALGGGKGVQCSVTPVLVTGGTGGETSCGALRLLCEVTFQ